MSEPTILHQKINLPYRYTAGEFHKAFLYGLADRRIVGSRCPACLTVAVPARPFCPECSAHSGETMDMKPQGTLETWSTVTIRGVTRTYGLIRIRGADTVMLHIVDAEPSGLRVGMDLVPRWSPEPVPEITAIEAFRPA